MKDYSDEPCWAKGREPAAWHHKLQEMAAIAQVKHREDCVELPALRPNWNVYKLSMIFKHFGLN